MFLSNTSPPFGIIKKDPQQVNGSKENDALVDTVDK